jgi:aminoglycoside/choline kinase family phosphotransferase
MATDANLESSLRAWLETEGFSPRRWTPLPGDVSPRRYFRLLREDGSSAIAAAYPPELAASCRRFVVTGALLTSVSVPVPEILAVEPEGRFMLLEDLGPTTLFERELSWEQRRPFYRQAAVLLERLQGLAPERLQELNPALDRGVLERELEQTWEVFLRPRRLLTDRGLEKALEGFFTHLCKALGEGPQRACHRDFMVRNLVPVETRGQGAGLAVLDHQDLRLGPAHYDLASLLNDSLFPPRKVEEEILEAAGITEPEPYHQAAVQRTFKAVGTFAAFALRGSERRLPLIPPTLRRGLEQMARLSEGRDLSEALRSALDPALEAF